tara:strand:+ start:8195 stop:8713 length:519 start_codon:yes stop_codon:yes gene_type:complete
MASDRIGKKSAELVALPPYKWYSRKASWLLEQPTVSENIENIPVNEPLMESLLAEGMHNPILCLKSHWPLAGGQRVRAIHEIRKNSPDYDMDIQVMQFTEDYHNLYYLWGDIEERNRIIAITFQLWELVFKSLYYDMDKTETGVDMTYYEDLGEELKWKLNDKKSKQKLIED